MGASKRMYVWYQLPSLRAYSDGIMAVIASSKEQAIKLAADEFIGAGGRALSANQLESRSKFLAELIAEDPEVISTGGRYLRGSE